MPPTPANTPRNFGDAPRTVRRRRLTEIPGGDFNRLPIAVRPLPDEPAVSWAARLAHRYQIGVQSLLKSLGIEVHAWTLSNFHEALLPHHGRLCDALGLPAQELFAPSEEASALQHMTGRYFAEYRPRRRRSPEGIRYCPGCLRERGGAWKQEWQQPLAMLCTVHKSALRTTCPGCAHPPWSAGSWLHGTAPAWECSRPDKSAQRKPRQRIPRCGFDLRRGPSIEPTYVELAIKVQRLVTSFAVISHRGPHQRLQLLGRDFAYQDAFFTLLEVMNAHFPAQPRADHEPFWISTSPCDQLFGLRDGALALVGADPQEAAQRLAEVLSPASRQAPLFAIENIRRHQHNPVLEHVMLTAHAERMSPTLQLTFRTANTTPRYPAEAVRSPAAGLRPRPGELPLSSIPQTLWHRVVPRQFLRADIDRATDAMLLARLGTLRSWQHLAIELGLPAAFRTRPPARLRWLRKHDLWHGLHQTLDELATRLAEHPPPINYQQRRRASLEGAFVLACTERALVGARAAPVLDVTGWARLFWQTYNEGDLRLAPAPLGLGLDAPTTARYPAGLTTHEVEDILQRIRWTLERSLRIDDDGPLWWIPP